MAQAKVVDAGDQAGVAAKYTHVGHWYKTNGARLVMRIYHENLDTTCFVDLEGQRYTSYQDNSTRYVPVKKIKVTVSWEDPHTPKPASALVSVRVSS